MIRDDNNKRPIGGDKTQRTAGSAARGPYPNSQSRRPPAGSSRAQRLAELENRGATGSAYPGGTAERRSPSGRQQRPATTSGNAARRTPQNSTARRPSSASVPGSAGYGSGLAQRGLPPGYDRSPEQGNRIFGQSGSFSSDRSSAQKSRPSAQSGRPSAPNRPTGQRRPPAQDRPSPGRPVLQGNNQRDFDREAARRRIEERRRKLEAKQKRQIEKQQKKHKNIRGRKRRRAKRIQALTMILAVFVVFFCVWPHLTDKVGEKEAAEPASATQRQEAGQETAKQESQMETNARNTSSEYLILVNKTHDLKADYEPPDLVDGKPAVSGGSAYQQMRKPAAAAFKKLAAAAKEEGHTIKITSGYRPYAYQKQIFERYVNKDGRYSAEQYSAEPGHSEHQTGLVADVSSPSVNYNLVQAYGATQEGAWLAKNAHKYGFIIRFPKGKEDITGYKYEPWHIRYVGKAAAKEIYKQKLTLEEYLEQV